MIDLVHLTNMVTTRRPTGYTTLYTLFGYDPGFTNPDQDHIVAYRLGLEL